MAGITPGHLLLVLIVALLVLGPGKLPEVGAALGKSIREFRKATSDVQEATNLSPMPSVNATSGAVATAAVVAPAASAAPVPPSAPTTNDSSGQRPTTPEP